MSPVSDNTGQAILIHDTHNSIARLTLNRPSHYNALSQGLLVQLQEALDAIAVDTSVRVVILAANGKAFCAGHDLKEIRSSESRAFHSGLFQQCARVMQTIEKMPQPVIAAVGGIATAAGCQLVAQCDLAIASDTARFAASGIRLGLFCSTPAVPLSRSMQRKKALHMLLTGDFIDAATACEYGLVNQVTSAGSLDTETQQLAEKIAAKSPFAIKLGKRLFYQQLGMELSEAYDLASDNMVCNMDSDDAREGIDAFIEKRQPTWRGR